MADAFQQHFRKHPLAEVAFEVQLPSTAITLPSASTSIKMLT